MTDYHLTCISYILRTDVQSNQPSIVLTSN